MEKKNAPHRQLLLIGILLLMFSNLMVARTNLQLRREAGELRQQLFRAHAAVIEKSPGRLQRAQSRLSSAVSPVLHVANREAVRPLQLDLLPGAESNGDGLSKPNGEVPLFTLDTLRRRAFPDVPETAYSLIVFMSPGDCPVSLREAVQWERLHRESGGDGNGRLAVVGIVGHTDEREGRQFVRQLDLTFPVMIDETGLTAALFSIDRTPFQLLVDREGVIQAMAGPRLGGNEWFFQKVESYLDQ